MKKVIVSIIILAVFCGGFFYWWQGRAGVRALNENLPEGVKVKKTLTGRYRVDNKKDGYVVAVPEAWEGVAKIEYHEDEFDAGISMEGSKGDVRLMGIGQYKLEEDVDLESWVEEEIQKSGLSVEDVSEKMKERFKFPIGIGIVNMENIGEFKVVEVEVEYFAGMFLYFFKTNLKIYEVGGMSEEFIREIILNSEW